MSEIFNPELYTAKRWDPKQLNIFKPGLLVGYGVNACNWIIKVTKYLRHNIYIEGEIIHLGTAAGEIGQFTTIQLSIYTNNIPNPIWIITSKDGDKPKTRFSILK